MTQLHTLKRPPKDSASPLFFPPRLCNFGAGEIFFGREFLGSRARDHRFHAARPNKERGAKVPNPTVRSLSDLSRASYLDKFSSGGGKIARKKVTFPKVVQVFMSSSFILKNTKKTNHNQIRKTFFAHIPQAEFDASLESYLDKFFRGNCDKLP